MRIQQQLDEVRARIAEAAQRAGRDATQVRLIAVTKGVAADRIREALEAGVTEIGENRVQEAREKRGLIPGTDFKITWHLLGHLQRNKARLAVELFDMIHSVDSLELIQTLERHMAARQTGALDVLIQVNLSGAATQFGCAPEQADKLARAVAESSHLRLAGLMALAPFSDNPEDSRPHFRKLRQLRDDLQGKGFSSQLPASLPAPCYGGQAGSSPLHLSMGMSQDFEVAVEEGATLVRVGTAIFGERSSR